jgi:hypothetical protein
MIVDYVESWGVGDRRGSVDPLIGGIYLYILGIAEAGREF